LPTKRIEDDAVRVGHRGLRLLMSPDGSVPACGAPTIKVLAVMGEPLDAALDGVAALEQSKRRGRFTGMDGGR
jgi:hypothetical protein